MSERVFEGDEWKNQQPAGSANPLPQPRTRAQEQAGIDTEYCNGRMALADWRAQTDELSDLFKWSARGRVK